MTPRQKKKKKPAPEPVADGAAPAASPQDAAPEGQAPAPEESAEVWRDRALRAQAEMVNMRRRMDLDVEERTRMRMEALFHDVITLADHLDMAMKAVPEEIDAAPAGKPFLQGLQAIRNSMSAILESHGLERIHPEEHHEFDSMHHEAVRTEIDAELERQRLELIRHGYRMGRRILRPAQVVLWLPAPAGEEPDGGPGGEED